MYLFEKCAWKTLRSGSFNQSIQLSTSGKRGRPPRDVGYRRMRIEIVPRSRLDLQLDRNPRVVFVSGQEIAIAARKELG